MNKTLVKSTTYDDRLEKNWKWCQAYFERKKKEFHLVGWKLTMDRAKTRLARCDEGKKTISISYHFLRGPSCDERKMRNTILHEFAHALAGCHNHHNNVWKTVALKIGCTGEKCGFMDEPDAKYIVECPKKCFHATYHRKVKVDNKLCGKCYGKLTLKALK